MKNEFVKRLWVYCYAHTYSVYRRRDGHVEDKQRIGRLLEG